MKGVNFSKVEVAHEDEKRKLLAIFNGDFLARQVKLIKVKSASTLGNHHHRYSELFYVMEGEATYTFESIKTRERAVCKLEAGDRVIIAPYIAHKAVMAGGTITIEATREPYSAESTMRYEVE